MRKLDYSGAIREAMSQEMERDERVFVYGIGVPTFSKIFGKDFGSPEALSRLRRNAVDMVLRFVARASALPKD